MVSTAQRDYAWSLERRILEKTCGRIRHLQVDTATEPAIVRGHCPCYHVKQLAIQALLELNPQGASFPFAIEIEVN